MMASIASGADGQQKSPARGLHLPRMGAFAWQLRRRTHAPTYYNEAFFGHHAIIVMAWRVLRQRRFCQDSGAANELSVPKAAGPFSTPKSPV